MLYLIHQIGPSTVIAGTYFAPNNSKPGERDERPYSPKAMQHQRGCRRRPTFGKAACHGDKRDTTVVGGLTGVIV